MSYKLIDKTALQIWQKYFGDLAFVSRTGQEPIIGREFCEYVEGLIKQREDNARESRKGTEDNLEFAENILNTLIEKDAFKENFTVKELLWIVRNASKGTGEGETLEERERLIEIAQQTLSEVERNGWTIQVHTNCLAILKQITRVLDNPGPNNKIPDKEQ